MRCSVVKSKKIYMLHAKRKLNGCVRSILLRTKNMTDVELELELEFYLFDRQLHDIGEIISKCKIILSGDYHKGINWPLT